MAEPVLFNSIDEDFSSLKNVEQKQEFLTDLYADSFEYLVVYWGKKYRNLNIQDIEDGISIVLNRIIGNPVYIEGIRSLKAFLTTCCQNEFNTMAKKKKFENTSVFSDLSYIDEDLSPGVDEIMESGESIEVSNSTSLDEVYSNLNNTSLEICNRYCKISALKQPRKKFLMRYLYRIEGYEISEIAEMTKLTEKTVETYISRVASELKKWGDDIRGGMYDDPIPA